MNEREARYSQPKLELYGLFRALRAYRLYLIGARNLRVEVDAKYIKGMLNEPDLQPNATINRWIQGILLFDFELVHVPADRHRGPDALSRKPLAEGEEVVSEDDSWLDEIALYVGSPIFSLFRPEHSTSDVVAVYYTAKNKQDQTLKNIYHLLTTVTMPNITSPQERKKFIDTSLKYFVKDKKLYKRNRDRPPLRAIIDPDTRTKILEEAHEGAGHRGVGAVLQTLRQRFYWPHMPVDVKKHVKSCHECQIISTYKAQIPLTISTPVTIFSKICIDVMYMPGLKNTSNPRYLVIARDDLSGASEGRALERATSDELASFFWEEIFCRYGAVYQVTTDNGPEVLGAFQKLLKTYHIPHIQITPYNSRANGSVERGHQNIRSAIVKTCATRGSSIKNWAVHLPFALFANKITARRSLGGISPYRLLYGVEPLLPFDLTEASFMIQSYKSGMTTAELLAARLQQLEKRPEDIAKAVSTLKKHRLQSKEQFEKRFATRLCQGSYGPGTLVLIRNTAIEKSLNRKTLPKYEGPYQVIRQRTGGAYLLAELDGTPRRQAIAAFRVVPYISRQSPQLQDLESGNDDESESLG